MHPHNNSLATHLADALSEGGWRAKPAQNNFRPPAIGMGGSSALAADLGRPAAAPSGCRNVCRPASQHGSAWSARPPATFVTGWLKDRLVSCQSHRRGCALNMSRRSDGSHGPMVPLQRCSVPRKRIDYAALNTIFCGPTNWPHGRTARIPGTWRCSGYASAADHAGL